LVEHDIHALKRFWLWFGDGEIGLKWFDGAFFIAAFPYLSDSDLSRRCAEQDIAAALVES